MQWKLAHFGLELNAPEDLIKHSSVEITRTIPMLMESTSEDPSEAPVKADFENTLLDPRLDGPKIEDTLLNTIGHINLAVPIPRPECMDQIVEHINKSLPLDFPLKKFGISKSTHFEYDIDGWAEEKEGQDLTVNPVDLYRALAAPIISNPPILIHGDQFTEHNVKGHPSLMMLTVLPVPSLVARPEGAADPLTIKLDSIVRLNSLVWNGLNNPNEIPDIILKDLISLLTYNVMTYLDNAIPGIASDDSVSAGITQLLGSEANIVSQAVAEPDIAGTTLHRIVRGINMGETAIRVHQQSEDAQSLSFELTKQVAFNRIWQKSGRDTQVIHINAYGEIQRMDIGVIENFSWAPWDGSQKIPREVVVAPRGSPQLIDAPPNRSLKKIIKQLQEVDEDYKLQLQQQLTLNYLYSMCEPGDELQEQLVVVCDVYLDPIVLRPLLRRMESQNKTGVSKCLILTGMTLNGLVSYQYEPTEDAYRNLVIGLASLNDRREFEHKAKMFEHLRPTNLKLISTFLKGLTRKEVSQLLGESILAKGKLDPDHLRQYIKAYLERDSKSTDHLKPAPLKPRRKLTMERLYRKPSEDLQDRNQDDDATTSAEGEGSEEKTDENDSLFTSLKGLEPLVRWAQLKGKMFTPAAAEFGFTSFPKGLLLTGVPGCGKTMAAKIIAEEWGMELHRVNPDDITSRFMGGNEENMRKLLNKLTASAPSICFVDEAEKLFTQMNDGIQGAATQSIDSTESMLLQFMEENESPVFFIFTANDLGKMSPAIIDRFEGRFFVDLPDEVARDEIIALMLNERKKGNLGLNTLALAKSSEGFTGRDIRGAIEEAMMEAFSENRELSQEDLAKAFSSVKPTSVVHECRIEEMRKLVSDGKIRSANSPRVIIKNADAKFDVSFG